MSDFESWIMGFVEGEGSFYCSIMTSTYKSKTRFSPVVAFELGQRAKDIRTIQEIRQFLSSEIGSRKPIGTITYRKSNQTNNSQPYVKFRVQNIKDNTLLRNYFMKQKWMTTKKNDFLIWSKIIDLINSKQHLNKNGLVKLVELRDSTYKLVNGKKRARYHYSEEIKSKIF